MDTTSIITLAVAAIIVLVWIGYAYDRKRSGAFHEFSRRRGLSFSERPDINVEDELKDFTFFSEGTDKRWTNLIKGEKDGADVMLFDYGYKTGEGQSSTSHNQTVLVMQTVKLKVPSFQLYPENILNRLFTVAGKQDIDFKSNTEFSGAYVLKGDDEKSIRVTFTDPVLSYLANHKGLNIEGNGQRVLIYRHGFLIKPDEIQSFLTEGMEVLRLFEKG